MRRTGLWYLLFAGIAASSLIASTINLSVLAMAEKEAHNATEMCGVGLAFDLGESELHQSMFNWTSYEQIMIMGAVFWLSWIMSPPARWLIDLFGVKYVFGSSMLVASGLAMVIPMAAYYHVYAMIAVRAAQGLLLGLTHPCLSQIFQTDRKYFETVASGSYAAVVVGYPVTAWIASSWRWDEVFYLTGLIGILWSLSWLFFAELTKELKGDVQKPSLIETFEYSLSKLLELFTLMFIPLFLRNIYSYDLLSIGLFMGVAFTGRTLIFCLALNCNYRKPKILISTIISGLTCLYLFTSSCNNLLTLFLTFMCICSIGLPNGQPANNTTLINDTLAGVLTSFGAWMLPDLVTLALWRFLFLFVAIGVACVGLCGLVCTDEPQKFQKVDTELTDLANNNEMK